MALTTTTLSASVGASDTTITVTSTTGFSAGLPVEIDQEIFLIRQDYVAGTNPVGVLRGQDGTVTAAHPSGANVNVGFATDFAVPGPGGPTVTNQTQRARTIASYSASGAIALPQADTDLVVILNGTSTLAMTLANPTKDADGSFLFIIANGKAAHTVTYAAGVGNGGSTMDVGTYNTTEATGCALVACNGFWVLWANGIGSAGTQVAGVVWA